MLGFEPRVLTTERSVVVQDDLLNTAIRLFYDPSTFRWRAYVLTPDGAFYREVFALSVCTCGVAEYCRRAYTGGNIYLDVCFCEEISIHDISLAFQPHWSVLAAYHAGNMRIYRRWQRAVVKYIADYIRERVKTLWESAKEALWYVFQPFDGVDVDYYGFFVTAYKYCPGVYYGIFCRADPHGCTPVNCRDICDVEHVDCDFEKLDECRARRKVIL
ncbi:MAG: hypothetical protein JZD41_07890 [Thermoproteus sp.]|nr:hypothetical protein [Thermoproteus sp.]